MEKKNVNYVQYADVTSTLKNLESLNRALEAINMESGRLKNYP